MVEAGPGRSDAIVVDQVLSAPGTEDVLEVRPGVGEHADPAVLGPLGAALGVEDPLIAGSTLWGARRGRPGVLDQHEGRHGIDHRDLHPLALPGALPVEESGHDGIGDGQPAHLVGHERRREQGFPTEQPEGVGQAGRRLDHVVIGRGVGGFRVARIALGLAVDDVGADRHHVLVGELEPSQGARPQIGHQHVRRGHHLQEGSTPGRGLDIEHDVALVAEKVEGHPRELGVGAGGHHPAQRPPWILDGDHIGAQVPEDLRGQGAHDDRGEIDDPDAVERSRGACRHRFLPPRPEAGTGARTRSRGRPGAPRRRAC